MISRNDLCWCGSQIKYKKCHWPTPSPIQSDNLADLYLKKYGIILKTSEQIKKIQKACKVSSNILAELMEQAKVGITTKQLDELSIKLHYKMNATPAALHYGTPPSPGSICTSINEVVCHGIPDDKPLQEGDILNIDVASIVDGFYGDCSAMVCLGSIDDAKRRVVCAAYQGTMQAIAILKPGTKLFEIGDIIEKVASKYSCSVVDQFVGHGVGLHFHERPEVPFHYNSSQIELVSGMTITIEPMINAGSRKASIDQNNGWEARTIDNEPSAQFEHTVLITKDGHEILTQWEFSDFLF